MKKPHEYLFVIYDKKGNYMRTLDDGLDAHDIASDPRFKEKLTVRTYKLLRRHEEPKGVPVKCCGRDHDGDGNCDIHSAPGVFRTRHPEGRK